MKQVLVILLNEDKKIEEIRKKYLPNYDKFKPHITLVYPFEIDNSNKLRKHISRAIKNIKPFKLSFGGLQKSAKENYLYLLVDNGKMEVVKLHKNLNGGILNKFRNSDMPHYIAHLSIGIFDSADAIDKAIKNISKITFDFETQINSIQLLTIDDAHLLLSVEDFTLTR